MMFRNWIIRLLIFITLLGLINSCNPDDHEQEPTGYYIQFETDGTFYFFSKDMGISIYYLSPTQDQLGFGLANNFNAYTTIYLTGSNILNRKLPATFSNSVGTFLDGIGSMQFFLNPDQVYTNYTKNGFSLTITTIENNIVKGEFSGILISADGLEQIKIKRGKFRVQYVMG